MATYNFSSLIGTTVNGFSVTADTLAILDGAANVRLAEETAGLRVSNASGSVLLAGVTLAQVTSTNVTINGGQLAVGDLLSTSILDSVGNTISVGTGANLVYGLGGGDTITVGNGNNVIFGGLGVTDSTDGGDVIVIGSGSNTIYANAGNDSVNFTAGSGTLTGQANLVNLGLGDDAFNTTGTLALSGNQTVYGGSGADALTFTGTTADVTVYGGQAETDATDGNDTILLGVGASTVFANAGNDSVTLGVNIAGKTANINLGLGNDTIVSAASVGNVVITGGSGTDTINVGTVTVTSDVTIYGGTGVTDTTDGADTITGSTVGGNVTIYANAGDDTISVASAAGKSSVVYGGLGNDTITLTTLAPNATTAGNFLLTLGTGADTVNADFSTQPADVVITDFGTGDVVRTTLSGAAGATGLDVSGNGSSIVVLRGANSAYAFATEERITFSNYTGDLNATNFVLSDGSRLITNFSSTATTLTGGTGADHLVSGSSNDTLISGGGVDKLVGGAGNDTFQFTAAQASAFDSTAVTVSGGDGTDTLEVTDTSAATLAANDFTATITNVEILKLSNAVHSVTTGTTFGTAGFTTIDANALAGTNGLTVVGTTATAGLTLSAANATSTGVINVSSTGSGADVINTAGGADTINIDGGGNDSVNSGAADDTISVSIANWNSSDTINGGAGTGDSIALLDISTGGSAVVDSKFTNVSNVETLTLVDGAAGAQSITLGTLASAAGLNYVNGLAETTHTITMDASAMTTGIYLRGGSIGDSLTGGSGNDSLFGGIGSTVDTLNGGAGSDRYMFVTTGTGNDIIVNTNFTVGSGGDIFDFRTGPTPGYAWAGATTETVKAQTNAVAGAVGANADLANNGLLVLTGDAQGAAVNINTLLNAGDIDTAGAVGTRIVVWEVDANTVAVGTLQAGGGANSIAVVRVADLTGFANQAAVDAFTTGLVSANFDII